MRELDHEGLPGSSEVGRFDCVVMADVLEHLRSAPVVLSAVKDLLADHGMIIASTGNVAHWYVRLGLLMGRFNYRDRGILDQTHVRLYTRRTFRRLVRGRDTGSSGAKWPPSPSSCSPGEGASRVRSGRPWSTRTTSWPRPGPRCSPTSSYCWPDPNRGVLRETPESPRWF